MGIYEHVTADGVVDDRVEADDIEDALTKMEMFLFHPRIQSPDCAVIYDDVELKIHVGTVFRVATGDPK